MSNVQDTRTSKHSLRSRRPALAAWSFRTAMLAGAAGLMLASGTVQADEAKARPAATPATCANVGQVWWNELLAPDTDQLSDFYSKVFGWSKSVVDVELQRPPATSPEDKYYLFKRGDQDVAGLMRFRHPDAPSKSVGWFVYIQVANVQNAVAAVEANGGNVMYAPALNPDGNEIAVVRDPMGNVFGLVTPASAKNC